MDDNIDVDFGALKHFAPKRARTPDVLPGYRQPRMGTPRARVPPEGTVLTIRFWCRRYQPELFLLDPHTYAEFGPWQGLTGDDFEVLVTDKRTGKQSWRKGKDSILRVCDYILEKDLRVYHELTEQKTRGGVYWLGLYICYLYKAPKLSEDFGYDARAGRPTPPGEG